MISMEQMAADSALYFWLADKGLTSLAERKHGASHRKIGPKGVCSEYEISIFIEAHIRGQMDERKRRARSEAEGL